MEINFSKTQFKLLLNFSQGLYIIVAALLAAVVVAAYNTTIVFGAILLMLIAPIVALSLVGKKLIFSFANALSDDLGEDNA